MGKRNIFQKAANALSVKLAFFKEAAHLRKLLSRYNASYRTWSDKGKLEYVILRQAHTIEKALSLRNTRRTFGQSKAEHLEEDIRKYRDLYGESEFLSYPIDTLAKYRKYIDNGDALACGAVNVVKAADIMAAASGNFESLVQSRHSVRYFAGPADRKDVIKALDIARFTPSACNRQAWRTRVFAGNDAVRLVKWQGGANGFEEEIRTAILVSSDLKGFLSYEPHQAWVDGGMYAMNLLNALHSVGLGTIPLSCAFDSGKLKGLGEFGLTENEVPILIIGTGKMEEEFKVALSERKSIEQTNLFI